MNVGVEGERRMGCVGRWSRPDGLGIDCASLYRKLIIQRQDESEKKEAN